ncbi:MAG: hypothetical protein K2G85_03855 [Muribaculaceae bacterium]|nr:hypothetical protein [Muribaculaceae bacterium]
MEIFNTIKYVIVWIRDFFILMWQDDEWWICIIGLIIVLIGLWKLLIGPLIRLFSGIFDGIGSVSASNIKSAKHNKDYKMKVTIKGVYQMNGPKPFVREISCSPSEAGYYSQLMTNKTKQAQWIRANFPGAETDKVFSMSVNIK